MDVERLTPSPSSLGACAAAGSSDYVLVTAARDEEPYIEETIRSVLRQTRPPLRWVVVSDGSTDRTDEIVNGYAARHDFITLARVESPARSFASKVSAFRRGYRQIEHLAHEFVGNLDADVSLPADYYERSLANMARRPRLGVCSSVYWCRAGSRLVRSRTRRHDTPGLVQLFRRVCYEQIGGYLPLEAGGEDATAAVMARMAGWETLSFPEPRVVVCRQSPTAEDLLRNRFAQGVKDYECGAHPLFMLAKAVGRITEPPYVVGGAALLGGYFGRWLRRSDRKVPDEVVRFLRREQLGRLLTLSS
jgi:glycosyltransferase involved in cell wall biosynthesis